MERHPAFLAQCLGDMSYRLVLIQITGMFKISDAKSPLCNSIRQFQETEKSNYQKALKTGKHFPDNYAFVKQGV